MSTDSFRNATELLKSLAAAANAVAAALDKVAAVPMAAATPTDTRTVEQIRQDYVTKQKERKFDEAMDKYIKGRSSGAVQSVATKTKEQLFDEAMNKYYQATAKQLDNVVFLTAHEFTHDQPLVDTKTQEVNTEPFNRLAA